MTVLPSFVDLVDGADLGVLDGRRSLGPLEAFAHVRVAEKVNGNELERYTPFEFRVLSLINDAHPTLAGLLEDIVVADGGSNTVVRLYCRISLGAKRANSEEQAQALQRLAHADIQK